MKKKLLSALLSAVMVMMPLGVHAGESETISQDAAELAPSAQAVCLIEASSGRQLYARQENKRMYPASMTKMMGLLLIYEELHSGALKLSDQVSASAEAAGMGGSQIYLKEGETMSVEDLLKSICIASANDAMVAMAEQISGTQEAFVERMNEKAQELKLSNTHFTNASGLHDPQHYSCASDMARIASALLQEGGEDKERYGQSQCRQRHRNVVKQRVLPHRRQHPQRYAEDQRHPHGHAAQDDGIGQGYRDKRVHIVVLVLVAGPEIAADDIEHVASVLDNKRLVHMIFGLYVSLYSLRKGPFPIERTTWRDAHNKEAESNNDEQSGDHAHQSFDNILCHQVILLRNVPI